MAGNTKEIRNRIKSVSSTRQLTKAMELVASSKIRRASEAMLQGREYLASLQRIVAHLASDRECMSGPYMKVREGGRTRIVVIAGDRGLAGGYNANVFRLAAQFPEAEFIPVGKRACERYGAETNSSERFSFEDARAMAEKLCSDFEEEKYDRLYVLFTEYHSVMTQEPALLPVLPFEAKEDDFDGGQSAAIFEPDAVTVLNHTARELVAGMITACVRESFASEVAARRMAMDSAGKNAKQMIDSLQLEYNRARQGAITQEITEIVAGSGGN
jgi:F-type H+-transporting ATPase subunit gamma